MDKTVRDILNEVAKELEERIKNISPENPRARRGYSAPLYYAIDEAAELLSEHPVISLDGENK